MYILQIKYVIARQYWKDYEEPKVTGWYLWVMWISSVAWIQSDADLHEQGIWRLKGNYFVVLLREMMKNLLLPQEKFR